MFKNKDNQLRAIESIMADQKIGLGKQTQPELGGTAKSYGKLFDL